MCSTEESNVKRFAVLLSLIVICWLYPPIHALAGDTHSYVFLIDQSTVTQTGGFAGVNETYPIQGQFQLTVDANAGVASFNLVDANLLNLTGFLYTQNMDELFNMTELEGTIVNEDLIEFSGKTDDDSDVTLQITFTDNAVQLTGQTTPPPGSADFFIFNIDAVAQKKYNGGNGTPEYPYQIANPPDLMALGNEPNDYDKHFILTNDIDLSPYTFHRAVIAPDINDVSLNFEGTTFSGKLDGQGHVIRNLHMQGYNYLGLIGFLDEGAVLINLGLEAVDINGIDDLGHVVGTLAGSNAGFISFSYSTGTVSGDDVVGGLAGSNVGSITSSFSMCMVSGNQYLGGLTGVNYGSINVSYSKGAVSGDDWVGGLVGRNVGSIISSSPVIYGIINASYSKGAVSGDDWVGGLVGENIGSITTSYSTGEVFSKPLGRVFSEDDAVGGLVGRNRGSIIESFWDIETSGMIIDTGGTGLTTIQMQTMNTFLEAGWDFMDETVNGTCQYWHMQEDHYPELSVFTGVVPVTPNGSGTPDDPYRITDTNELGLLGYHPHASYRLDADIDLTGIAWSIAVVPWFDGSLDGNGHVIRNLHIQGVGHLGLFGILASNASLIDVALEDIDVYGIDDYVGGLAGVNYNSIISSSSTGSVSGDDAVGGLVGFNYRGSIISSYSMGDIGGAWDIGGLVGNNGGSITSSHSACSVSGDTGVGGLVGGHSPSATMTSSYSTGSVSMNDIIKKLWERRPGTIGGLVGRNAGTIISCYSTSSVSGRDITGGLVGDNGGSITSSYSTGTVSGRDAIGGLVGWNGDFFSTAVITSCYSVSEVNGNDNVGGLVGRRGFLGTDIGEIISSFWNIETSGLQKSEGGIGLTTAEMLNLNTFLDAGWDFVNETVNGTDDIWWIDDGNGYPRLWWEQ